MPKHPPVTTKESVRLSERIEEMRLRHSAPVERIAALREELFALREKMREPVEAALRAVNGRAERHAITLFCEVERVAERAEKLLAARGVTQKNRVGTVATYRPAGPSANAYKYAAATTLIRLTRVTDGWRFLEAQRSEVNPKQSEIFELRISPAARDDVLRAAMHCMSCGEPVTP